MANQEHLSQINLKEGEWHLERCGQFADVRSSLHLDTNRVTIGRSETMTHMMDEKFSFVSRCHTILTFNNGAWFLKDNKSLNGTYINKEKIVANELIQLHEDDVIGLGVPTSKLNDQRALIYAVRRRHKLNDEEKILTSPVVSDDVELKCNLASFRTAPGSLGKQEVDGLNTVEVVTLSPDVKSGDVVSPPRQSLPERQPEIHNDKVPRDQLDLSLQLTPNIQLPVSVVQCSHCNTVSGMNVKPSPCTKHTLRTSDCCCSKPPLKHCGKFSTFVVKTDLEKGGIVCMHSKDINSTTNMVMPDRVSESDLDDIPLSVLRNCIHYNKTEQSQSVSKTSEPECVTISDSDDQILQDDVEDTSHTVKPNVTMIMKEVKVKVERLTFVGDSTCLKIPSSGTQNIKSEPVESSCVSAVSELSSSHEKKKVLNLVKCEPKFVLDNGTEDTVQQVPTDSVAVGNNMPTAITKSDCTNGDKMNSIKQEACVDLVNYTQEDEVIVISDDENYFNSSQNWEKNDDENDDWQAAACILPADIIDLENDQKVDVVSTCNAMVTNDMSDDIVCVSDEALTARLVYPDNSDNEENMTKIKSGNGNEEKDFKKDDGELFFPELSQAFWNDDENDKNQCQEKQGSSTKVGVKKSKFYGAKVKEIAAISPKKKRTLAPQSSTLAPKKKRNAETLRYKVEKQMGFLKTKPCNRADRSSGTDKIKLPVVSHSLPTNPKPIQTPSEHATALVQKSLHKRILSQSSKNTKKPTSDVHMSSMKPKFRFANRGAFLIDELGKKLNNNFKIPKKQPISKERRQKMSSIVMENKVSRNNMGASVFSIDSLLPPPEKEMPTESLDKSTYSKRIPGAKELRVEKTFSQIPTRSSTEMKRKISIEKELNSSMKRVRFSESNETFEIEASSRDRTKDQSSTNGSCTPVVTPPQIQLEDVLMAILSWNPVWLDQQEHLKTPPPVVKDKIWPTLLSYKSYADYFNVFYPLLLLETWAQVTKEWRRHSGGFIVGAAAVKEVTSNSKTMDFTCFVLIMEEDLRHNRYIREGHLVILDVPLTSVKSTKAENQKEIIKVFGYVDYFGKFARRNEDIATVLKEHPLAKDHTAKLAKLIVKTKCRQLLIDRLKLMRIQMISYIKPSMRQFGALFSLPRTILAKNILCPQLVAFDLSRNVLSNLKAKGHFNNRQKEAILSVTDACSRGCSARICLLQGPPGTGKTNMIIGLTQQLIYADDIKYKIGMKPKILLTAPSNAAVDELVIRLIRSKQAFTNKKRLRLIRVGPSEQIHPRVREYTLDALLKSNLEARIKEKSSMESVDCELNTLEAKRNKVQLVLDSLYMRKEVEKAHHCELELKDITNRLQRLKQQKEKSQLQPIDVRKEEQEMLHVLLKGADVIATTLTSCRQAFPDLEFSSQMVFTVCIVDEASQCIEQDTLLPLMFGITKLVLVGDPQQLPATVISQQAAEMGLNQSLFERFYKYFIANDVISPVYMLTKQYRMHPEICKFPSKFFYEGKLETDSLLETRYKSCPFVPYLIFNLIDAQEAGNKGDLHNIQEIDFVLQLLKIIVTRVNHSTTIGVITPYQTQRTKIKNALKLNLSEDYNRIEINTVDGFQGREKDIIILSTVRAKSPNGGIGFLSQEKRLNVALTRAKQSFFICGHLDTLSVQIYWRALIHDAQERGLAVNVTKDITVEQLTELFVKTPVT